MHIIPTDDQDYIQQHLKGVSRSFALVIPVLEPPLDHYIGLSYLLCRIADNIEDVEKDNDFKTKRFDEFFELLDGNCQATFVLKKWQQFEWNGLTPAEKDLMNADKGLKIWELYQQIPANQKRHISYWVGELARGMANNLKPQSSILKSLRQNNMLGLYSFDDYNRYCYIVAGNVGHLVTRLTAEHYGFNQKTYDNLLATCESFARALQKTNIIKDFAKDLSRGICYIPQQWLHSVSEIGNGISIDIKQTIFTDLYKELNESVQYLSNLPYTAKGYRMASLLCLLPAFETVKLGLSKIQETLTMNSLIKINRNTWSDCYNMALQMLENNDELMAYGKSQRKYLETTFNSSF